MHVSPKGSVLDDDDIPEDSDYVVFRRYLAAQDGADGPSKNEKVCAQG